MSTVKADKITYAKGGHEYNLEQQLVAGYVSWDSTTGPITPLEELNLTIITDNATGDISFGTTNTYLEANNIFATGACLGTSSSTTNARTCSPYSRTTTSTSVNTGDNNTDVLIDIPYGSLYQYGAYA